MKAQLIIPSRDIQLTLLTAPADLLGPTSVGPSAGHDTVHAICPGWLALRLFDRLNRAGEWEGEIRCEDRDHVWRCQLAGGSFTEIGLHHADQQVPGHVIFSIGLRYQALA